MTCKDCIHYEICQIMSEQYGISKVPSCQCGFFKPSADVVEVRHGHWIEKPNPWGQDGSHTYICSECNERISVLGTPLRYCPFCGAKMDGERS